MFRPLHTLVLLSLFTIAAPPIAPLAHAAPQNRAAKPVFTGVLNLNTASAGEFEALPGIGAKTAALIVEYRQKNGPFKRVEDLMNIRGIGEKNFLKLKPQITVAPPKAEKGAHP
jgi:competence protein ComEA